MDRMTCEQVRQMLLACADRIIRNEPYLTKIDSAIGDGDHGIGMKLHAALHACTTMNENQVQQTKQHGKI